MRPGGLHPSSAFYLSRFAPGCAAPRPSTPRSPTPWSPSPHVSAAAPAQPPAPVIASSPASFFRRARFCVAFLSLLTLLVSGLWVTPARAQPPAPSRSPVLVPAGRQANSVAIISIHGPIDAITAASVERRIQQAVDGKADALVFELNTPGGELGAVLQITAAIRASGINNTIAWIHPEAYSGGAIIALACREIVVASAVSFGDAKPVQFGPTGLKGLSADERLKLLPPLLAELVGSARRHNDTFGAYRWDEHLVSAIVLDDVRLWYVQDKQTGARFAITEAEFVRLFPDQPEMPPLLATASFHGGASTSPPALPASVPPPVDPAAPPSQPADPAAVPADSPADPSALPPPSDPGRLTDSLSPAEQFRANSRTSAEVADRVNEELMNLGALFPSRRPVIDYKNPGRYTLVGKLTNGDGPIVLTEREMAFLGIASNLTPDAATGQLALAPINNPADLQQFLGAASIVRLDESWSDALARFLSGNVVRGILIAGFLICFFLEIIHPGVSLPGGVALICLAFLFAPSFIIGVAMWWQILAILLGILFLLLELLVIPGFGVFGVVGLVGIFAGLVGAMIPITNPLAPASERNASLLSGVLTVLLSTVSAVAVLYFISKNFASLPLFGRLVLRDGSDDDAPPSVLLAMDTAAPLRAGDVATTITPLRPAGKIERDGQTYDVVADLGFIAPGTRVRVTEVTPFRTVVEPLNPSSPAPAASASAPPKPSN